MVFVIDAEIAQRQLENREESDHSVLGVDELGIVGEARIIVLVQRIV